MPSTAASHMIFFIAAIVVSIGIAGTLIGVSYKFSESMETRGAALSDSLRTDIKILNDEVAMPYNASNNTLTLYIMNTGSTIINAANSSVIVMINGTFFDNLTFVNPGSGSSWMPKTVITIVVGDVTLAPDDYRLKVTANKADDVISFRIT